MKVVAIIPIKKNSTRVPGKNFIKINGVPLYKILLDKVLKCKFDEIYVDSDSDEINKYCKKNKIHFIKRLPKLAKNSANGNDLINYHSKIIDADIYFQLFITSPLMTASTINSCIKFLKNTKKYDSILTSKSLYSWFWHKKKPVNYSPKKLPRSQDATPVVVETTGLYGISKRALKKYKCRIGNKPFFFEVQDDESIDLDNAKDFEYLNYTIKKRKKIK
tara:strand:- start:264 stop:920 length:657 start_codon:yes stop_codon:yes gene_type:complete